MSPKKITLSLLLLATIAPNNLIMTLSDNAYAECYQGKDSEYRYLEFYFIEQPKNLLDNHINKARSILLATVSAGVLTYEFFNFSKLISDNKKSESINFNSIAVSAASFFLSLTGFEIYSAIKEDAIQKDALVKFIANWKFHRDHVPSCLVSAFDELATAFAASEDKTFSDSDTKAIFEVIKHLLEHEFSSRYKKADKKSEDTLGLFKTITDISKNLK